MKKEREFSWAKKKNVQELGAKLDTVNLGSFELVKTGHSTRKYQKYFLRAREKIKNPFRFVFLFLPRRRGYLGISSDSHFQLVSENLPLFFFF